MMINELPRNTMDIATTYFEDPKIQSQFKKDMDNNMKMLSGVDPVVSNEELSNQINTDNNTLLDNGTADAMLVRNDRESLELLTQNMEIMGAMSRSNSKISAADYYTQTEMANRAAIDDIYRINLTNSKDDPRIYSTKSMIGFEKIAEALDELKPNYIRNTVRYLGQPALSIGLAVATKGKAAPFTDAIMAGWDSSILGDTIYNVQENYNQRYYDILNSPSLTLEQFEEEMENFVKDIQTKVAPEYQFEIFNSLVEGPNPFADAGLSFTSLGIKNAAMSVGFLAKMARKALPFKQGMSLKRMQMNQDLVEKIRKSITNSVDESVVDDNIASEVAAIAPKDTKQEDIDTVKGLVKNEINDEKLLSNSNKDFTFFDRLLRGLSGADEKTGSNQRGEIKLERPEQSYFIDHGKGVNGDQPMTSEEADELLKKLQGRGNPITPWKRTMMGETVEFNPDIEPDYIAIQSASRERWTDDINKPGVWNYGEKRKSGEGKGLHTAEAYLAGGYGSVQDSPEVAAKFNYYVKYQPDAREEAFENLARLSDKQIEEGLDIIDPDYITRNEALFNPDLSEGEVLEKRLRRNGEIFYDVYDQLFKNTKDPSVLTPLDEMIITALNDYRVGNVLSYYDVSESIIHNARYYKEGFSEENISNIKKLMNEIKGNSDKYVEDAYQAYEELSKKAKELFPDLNYMKGSIYVDPKEIEAYKYRVINHFNDSDNYSNKLDPYVREDGSLSFEGLRIAKNFGEENKYLDFAIAYDEYLEKIHSLMGNLQSLGRAERTLKNIEDPNFTPPSSYLQTLGIRNPMKNPEGFLYLDQNRGLRTFSSLFSTGSNEKNTKLLKEIKKKDQKLINSITEDIKDGWKQEHEQTYVTNKKLADEKFKEFSDDLPDRMVRGDFEDLLERYVMPYSDIKDMSDFKAWQQAYLKEKGVRANFHNMGRSQSFNVAIQNFEDVTPVTLEETNIGTKWYSALAYDNAHFKVPAGDGVGFFVRELHGVEGAKPMIMINGKVLDMGDYKPYNK